MSLKHGDMRHCSPVPVTTPTPTLTLQYSPSAQLASHAKTVGTLGRKFATRN